MSRRVAITGLGIISPIGNDLITLWNSLQKNRSAIAPLTRFDATPFRAKLAAEINDFEPSNWFPPHRLKRLDRYSQFALAAALQAIHDAGLLINRDRLKNHFGISCGTALGGISNAEEQHAKFLNKGTSSIPPALALQVFGGSAHSQIAIEFGISGYATTNSNSCAAGTVAVGEAWRAIREGVCDVMLAVGAEAPLSPLTFGAFDILQTMSSDGYFCFDRRRKGFVMAEGAACLICEEWNHAQKRNASIYGEILGYALNNDAYHMTSPRPDGSTIIECMEKAIQTAALEKKQIDYIHAHASGTRLNDASETAAIRAVFGSHTDQVLVSGTKPFHGHSLGAVGTIELLLCCLALKHQWLPPTLNLEQLDPDCALNHVPANGIHRPIHHILKNSFGFGGINACVVLGLPH